MIQNFCTAQREEDLIVLVGGVAIGTLFVYRYGTYLLDLKSKKWTQISPLQMYPKNIQCGRIVTSWRPKPE